MLRSQSQIFCSELFARFRKFILVIFHFWYLLRRGFEKLPLPLCLDHQRQRRHGHQRQRQRRHGHRRQRRRRRQETHVRCARVSAVRRVICKLRRFFILTMLLLLLL